MCDIIYDLESEQEAGKAVEWYGYVLDNAPIQEFEINYKSYCEEADIKMKTDILGDITNDSQGDCMADFMRTLP